MSLWYKLFPWVRPRPTVGKNFHLISEEREGGYLFVRSPDLPGFTMMLDPGADENIHTLMDALFEPLAAFIHASYMAGDKAPPQKAVNLTGFRRTSHANYVAELCPA
jgi:hypothetical protein